MSTGSQAGASAGRAAPGAPGPSGPPSAAWPSAAQSTDATPPGARTGRTPRPAVPADVPEILRLIRELADYERSLSEVSATEEHIHALLFGATTPSGHPAAHCHVVDAPDGTDGRPRLAAFALWFLNASTWLGTHGIYLEDLYVSPAHRGRGIGRDLMATLAGLCVEHGYGRLEWSVLDWNTPALDFYGSLGARPMDEWTVHRLAGTALRDLAESDPRAASGRP